MRVSYSSSALTRMCCGCLLVLFFVVSGYVEDVFLGSLNSLPWEGVQCVANPYA